MSESSQPHAAQFFTETILFGGYEPVTRVLQLTVEASSLEEAIRRMTAVALLVEIKTRQGMAKANLRSDAWSDVR